MNKRKKANCLIKRLAFLKVGITGLEPATSRPPDVCATNCAKSRSFANCGCKGKKFIGDLQVFPSFFLFFSFSLLLVGTRQNYKYCYLMR